VNVIFMQFLAALALGGAVALTWAWWRGRVRGPVTVQRMRRLGQEQEGPKRGLSWDELRVRGPSNLPLMRDYLLQRSWARRMALDIEQSGVKLRVGEYLIGRVALALITFSVIWGLGRSLPTFILGMAVGAGAYMLPALWLSAERNRRHQDIARQLPEAAQMIANALRAGFSFQHGVALVADQMEAPIADEFARANVDMNMGSTIEESLHALLSRADTSEMNLVVTAVLVQRTAGGNLAEILEMVSENIRERERLTGEVRTLTAQQRFSGLVLSMWPLLLLGGFALLNWGQTSLLFTTNAGLILVAAAAGLQLMGFLTIRRILDVEL
jgi:tight adherence protein B